MGGGRTINGSRLTGAAGRSGSERRSFLGGGKGSDGVLKRMVVWVLSSDEHGEAPWATRGWAIIVDPATA
ncbi:hypothetical protein HPP92_027537, partial [Vanilla planifolia]